MARCDAAVRGSKPRDNRDGLATTSTQNAITRARSLRFATRIVPAVAVTVRGLFTAAQLAGCLSRIGFSVHLEVCRVTRLGPPSHRRTPGSLSPPARSAPRLAERYPTQA